MSWAYTTVEQMMATLTIGKGKDKSDPDWLLEIAQGVSQEIDRECDRTFRIYEGTQYFTPEWHDLLFIPDLLSFTSIKIDNDWDGVYEITLAEHTDFFLEPFNAPSKERPYTRIRQAPRTFYYFPKIEKSVQIVGKWGYSEKLRSAKSPLTQAITTTDTEFTVADVSAMKRGWTIKIDSEQMFVIGKDETASTIEVERGQNGTTAATHDNAATIYRYVYPEALSTAALLQAARIYRRSETPLGIVNNPGDIGWRAVYVPKLDLDVQKLLEAFKKRNSV